MMTTETVGKAATLGALIFSVCPLGCDPPKEAAAAEAQDQAVAALVSDLVDAGYPRDDIEVTERGELIVQGDGVLDVEAHQAREGMSFRQFHTTNMVKAEIDSIYIYVDPGLMCGLTDEEKKNFNSAINVAIHRWRELGVRLTHYKATSPDQIPSPLPANIAVTTLMRMDAPSTCTPDSNETFILARSDFPTAQGLPGPTIRVTECLMKKQNMVGVQAHALMHEIGHTVGMRHTDYKTRGSCGGKDFNEGAAPDGAVPIEGTDTDTFDVDSVMNACLPTSPSKLTKWSTQDKIALWEIY